MRFSFFLLVINHLIKYTHNIIQHDASIYTRPTRIMSAISDTLENLHTYTPISNRGWTFLSYIWLYTISYNNLDDWAADNCAMHCQSNIANNVKEYALMIFNFLCFLQEEKHIYCFRNVFLSRKQFIKIKRTPWKEGKSLYNFHSVVVNIVSVIANIYYSPFSSWYAVLVFVGASEDFKTFITFAGWEIG